MSNFNKFAEAVKAQFNKMAEHDLFLVDASKDSVWDHYMASFPEGTNTIFRERREHDCNYCRQFIKNVGNVVAIIDGKLVSVWDVVAEDYYQDVTNAMASFVKSHDIRDIFIYREATVGKQTNQELTADGKVLTWSHFNCIIPARFVNPDVATIQGKANSVHGVFKRGLDTIDMASLEIVEDLIAQDAIYRGAEHKDTVAAFVVLKRQYDALDDDAKKLFTWSNLNNRAARFRNSVIGTLVSDIAEGMELVAAVKSFESKVAPANYKRTSAPVTQGMIKQALSTIEDLGLNDSLQRRYATSEDLSINNVLFADRSIKMADKGSLEDILMASAKKTTKTYDKVEEIKIDDFIANVLPKVDSVSVLMKNSLVSNLASLVAPTSSDAPNILQWDNNFSWTYNGDITDSMKEKVKAAGGAVDGVLRFSIQWNDNGKDGSNDLDAHCYGPGGMHINFSSKRDTRSHGQLDVDIQRPGSNIAVENITWPNLNNMPDGDYKFTVNRYAGTNTGGFSAEIEMAGEIHQFTFAKGMSEKNVTVATVTLKNGTFTIKPALQSSMQARTEWGVTTEEFVPVSTMLLSPNHWDGQAKGNKHYFFMLKDCINPNDARGLYSEFLHNNLTPHRKVFELLGSKLKCAYTDHQLSGLGFSSTQRSELIVKVTGSFNRMLKIKF